MDLIERQAAIRKLKRMATQAYIDKLNGSAETVINCCIDVIERQIPSAEPEPQWIPVMERLPEIKQRVLITYNTEDGLKTDVTWYDKYGFLLSGDVTAWMPMVEPYKEESGE